MEIKGWAGLLGAVLEDSGWVVATWTPVVGTGRKMEQQGVLIGQGGA